MIIVTEPFKANSKEVADMFKKLNNKPCDLCGNQLYKSIKFEGINGTTIIHLCQDCYLELKHKL